MSRKPLKHSEVKNVLGRKQRKTNYIEPLEYYLIVCEGKKTEPNYFEEIKKIIDMQYQDRVAIKEINIQIEGEATNTLFLLDKAKKYVAELKGQVTQVWLVYDKDDFPLDRFDTTYFEAERLSRDSDIQYHAAWSNQCVEYWFLLHFENLQSDINRDLYIEKLNNYFIRAGVGEYKKKRTDIFTTLCKIGNVDHAIRYAKRRMKEHIGKTPSQSVPATRIYEIIEELFKYFPKQNKEE